MPREKAKAEIGIEPDVLYPKELLLKQFGIGERKLREIKAAGFKPSFRLGSAYYLGRDIIAFALTESTPATPP